MYQTCNSEEILTETTNSISLKEVIVSSQDVAMDKKEQHQQRLLQPFQSTPFRTYGNYSWRIQTWKAFSTGLK